MRSVVGISGLQAGEDVKLKQTGQIHVTRAAARAFAAWSGLRLEAARRALLEQLCEARRLHGDSPTGAERWRYRNRQTGADLEAHVTREGSLAVVVRLRARGKPRTEFAKD
jgi:hypothetical protein